MVTCSDLHAYGGDVLVSGNEKPTWHRAGVRQRCDGVDVHGCTGLCPSTDWLCPKCLVGTRKFNTQAVTTGLVGRVKRRVHMSVALPAVALFFAGYFPAEGVGIGVGNTGPVYYGKIKLAHEIDPPSLLSDEVLGRHEIRQRRGVRAYYELPSQ